MSSLKAYIMIFSLESRKNSVVLRKPHHTQVVKDHPQTFVSRCVIGLELGRGNQNTMVTSSIGFTITIIYLNR